MRILLVTSKYLPSVGGLETAVRELNARLRAAGHETLIVTNRHSRRLPPDEVVDGTTVRRFIPAGVSPAARRARQPTTQQLSNSATNNPQPPTPLAET